MNDQTHPTAAPTGQPAGPRESIRDVFMQKMARERGDAPAPARVSEPQPRPSAEPVDTTVSSVEEPVDKQDAATPTDVVEQEEADDGLTPELREARETMERLQKREKEMSADYTRKTQRIAEEGRKLEADSVTIRSTAQYLSGFIEHPLKQFEAVPWEQLQAQDPARYQQIRGQYQNVLNARNNLMQMLAQMESQHDTSIERHRQSVAEVSKDILRTKIKDWSNQKYAALRDLAVSEFGFTAAEIDQTIDHRFIELLNEVSEARNAGSKLKGVTRDDKSKPPQGANKQVIRNESGQYQNAKQAFMGRPGDRNAARSMFAAKLAAERKGR